MRHWQAASDQVWFVYYQDETCLRVMARGPKGAAKKGQSVRRKLRAGVGTVAAALLADDAERGLIYGLATHRWLN